MPKPDNVSEPEHYELIHGNGTEAEQRASIVGIPRESYVEIPGYGTNKINAALFYGGPELVVQTVEQLANLRRAVPLQAHLLDADVDGETPELAATLLVDRESSDVGFVRRCGSEAQE